MKVKHFLALAALAVGGGNLSAQVNYVAGWDGGTSTDSPSTFGWTSSENRILNPLNTNGGIRITTTYDGYKLADGTAYTYSESSELSSKIFWLRYKATGESFTYTFEGLEAGHIYKFSALVGWHNNSTNPTFTIEAAGTTSYGKTSRLVTTKQTLYPVDLGFTVPASETATSFKLVFTCNKANDEDCMEALTALSLVEDFDAYLTILEEKIAEASAISSPMSATAQSELSKAIADAQAVVDGADHGLTTILAVLNPLNAAIEAAHASLEDYARLKLVIDNATTDVTAIQSAYDAGTIEDVESQIAAIHAAAKSAALATEGTEASPADWTGVIVNPSFEEYETLVINTNGGKQNNPAGWQNSKVWAADAWNYSVLSEENATQGNNSFKVRFNWAGDTYSISQTVTDLPRGKYKLTADVKNYNANGSKSNAKVSINSFETESKTITDATTIDKEFFLSEDGDIVISLTSTYIYGRNSSEGILYWDNIKLQYYGTEALEAAELAAAQEALSKAIEAATAAAATAVNKGDAAFQIPTSAVTTFEAAIATAQDVLDNATAKSAVEEATATLNEATAAYKGTALTAPLEGKRYIIRNNTASDFDFTGTPVTVIPNAKAQGGYDLSWGTAANTAFAQSFVFLPAGATNQYYLAFYDDNKQLHYLCDGRKYGNTVGWAANQIRSTTNADYAFAVEVVATDVEGIWNLVKVDIDTKIGSNGRTDKGFYTSGARFDLNIAEAAEAAVELNIPAGKYATRIFPFTPELPAGVKAYSIGAVEGTELTLAPVEEVKANEPYVLQNTTTEDVTATLSGFGTAVPDTTYTAGLLTGVYAAKSITAGYVLQTLDSKQAFYAVDSEAAIEVPAFRAYLTVPAGEAKAFYFPADLETAIRNLEATDAADAAVFNLAGQRFSKAGKGVYIVNGKKVAVN